MNSRLGVLLGTLLLLASCTSQVSRPPVASRVFPPTVPPAVPQAPYEVPDEVPYQAPPEARIEAPPRVEPISPGRAIPPAAVVPAPPVGAYSGALTRDGYKKDVAAQIYRANAQHLYTGRPPPLLKAVIVLNLRVDDRGNPTHISIMRSNGYKPLEALAMQSVRNAAPLPSPSRLSRQGGSVEFVETWLFRSDGRFQLHTLAELQAISSR